MAMTYDAFLDQMKKDLEAGFAEDLPAKYRNGMRSTEPEAARNGWKHF